jgi:hypothetical protein
MRVARSLRRSSAFRRAASRSVAGARGLALGLGLSKVEDAALARLDLEVEIGRLELALEVRFAAPGRLEPGLELGEAAPELGELALPLLDAERRGGALRRRLGHRRRRGCLEGFLRRGRGAEERRGEERGGEADASEQR